MSRLIFECIELAWVLSFGNVAVKLGFGMSIICIYLCFICKITQKMSKD